MITGARRRKYHFLFWHPPKVSQWSTGEVNLLGFYAFFFLFAGKKMVSSLGEEASTESEAVRKHVETNFFF